VGLSIIDVFRPFELFALVHRNTLHGRFTEGTARPRRRDDLGEHRDYPVPDGSLPGKKMAPAAGGRSAVDIWAGSPGMPVSSSRSSKARCRQPMDARPWGLDAAMFR